MSITSTEFDLKRQVQQIKKYVVNRTLNNHPPRILQVVHINETVSNVPRSW